MTHPLDKPLGPKAQSDCHWSHHDGDRMQYDFMVIDSRQSLQKGMPNAIIETMRKLTERRYPWSLGLDEVPADEPK